MAISISKLS